MKINVWQQVDFVEREIPDALLRPMVERLLTQKDWDRNLDRLYLLIRNTKLEVFDWLLQQDQQARSAAPTEADAVEAAAILAEAEAPEASTVWEQGAT